MAAKPPFADLPPGRNGGFPICSPRHCNGEGLGVRALDTVNVSFQILPRVEGMHVYDAVDRAIAVVQASGVRYEVGPMETTMEGDYDQLMGIVKEAQEACMVVGASSVMTIIKVSWVRGGASIDEKIGKYRAGFRADRQER